MSDAQRRRVYRSEHALADMAVPLPGIEYARALVSVIERKPFYPERHRGLISCTHMGIDKAFYRGGVIHLPADRVAGEWAWNDIVVCHEVAHHISQGDLHGEVFTYRLLQILDAVRPSVAEALREQYRTNKVRVRVPQP
jgi:putative metallohydrolase (TIGR04338 family)